MEPTWVDTEPGLADLVARLADEPRYALDTEFHGERSYWPRPRAGPDCLAGRHRADRSARRRPRAARRSARRPGLHGRARGRPGSRDPRARVRRSPDRLVRHAGRGGLHRPRHAVARRRSSSGCSTSGSTKGDRLTDWTRRPLRVEQRVYAAADVEHLLALHDVLVARLERSGRLPWALDECEERRQRIRTRPEPEVGVVAHQRRAPAPRQGTRRRAGGRGVARTHRGSARRAAALRALGSRARRDRAATAAQHARS